MMAIHTHDAPQPLLVLVTGTPGSGKSTLALLLGRADHLDLPVLSRDALKAGMVETWTFSQPKVSRQEIETDDLRSHLVPRSFDLFYATIAQWLQAGTSLIAEYGFDRRVEPALARVTRLATTVVVHCKAPHRLCQQRFMQREQRDGTMRPDRLASIAQRVAEGTDPWTRFEPLTLPLPTLRVDTTDAYAPTLPDICAFCRATAHHATHPLSAE